LAFVVVLDANSLRQQVGSTPQPSTRQQPVRQITKFCVNAWATPDGDCGHIGRHRCRHRCRCDGERDFGRLTQHFKQLLNLRSNVASWPP
jgi:hypothetical protein